MAVPTPAAGGTDPEGEEGGRTTMVEVWTGVCGPPPFWPGGTPPGCLGPLPSCRGHPAEETWHQPHLSSPMPHQTPHPPPPSTPQPLTPLTSSVHTMTEETPGDGPSVVGQKARVQPPVVLFPCNPRGVEGGGPGRGAVEMPSPLRPLPLPETHGVRPVKCCML